MEYMSASQLSNGLPIVRSEVTHANDAALLHFRVVWIINLPPHVNKSFYWRNSLNVFDYWLLFGMRHVSDNYKGKYNNARATNDVEEPSKPNDSISCILYLNGGISLPYVWVLW